MVNYFFFQGEGVVWLQNNLGKKKKKKLAKPNLAMA